MIPILSRDMILFSPDFFILIMLLLLGRANSYVTMMHIGFVGTNVKSRSFSTTKKNQMLSLISPWLISNFLYSLAGEYAGLTGARLDGAEMLACGLATHFVPSEV